MPFFQDYDEPEILKKQWHKLDKKMWNTYSDAVKNFTNCAGVGFDLPNS